MEGSNSDTGVFCQLGRLELDGFEARGGFLEDGAALGQDPIGKEDTVKVIKFMLDVGGFGVGESFFFSR